MNLPPLKTISDLPEAFVRVLGDRGVSPPANVTPVKEGGNNQVFKIEGKSAAFALKRYFQHPGDARDRFKAERQFYTLLWPNGVRQIAEPLAWDADHRLGLFSFLDGKKLTSGEITRETGITQAMNFVRDLNALRNRPEAKNIATASDGFFSVAEHLESVGGRVEALGRIEIHSELDRQAIDFVTTEMMPKWQAVAAGVNQFLAKNPSLAKPLEQNQRTLSPSDFGFHNAIWSAGALSFIDFEYAGWDDPAKLVCDFFCQPQVPVKLEHWAAFNTAVAGSIGMAEADLAQRSQLLFPVFQMKWCCIILNQFIKIGRARREFAGVAASDAAAASQLEKAHQLLQSIQTLPH